MIEQISMFETFDPLKELVKNCSPYWKGSYDRIKEACKGNSDRLAEITKHEFCPYGFAGAYGRAVNKVNEVNGYDMRANKITVYYYDGSGTKCEKDFSWRQFAEELAGQMVD